MYIFWLQFVLICLQRQQPVCRGLQNLKMDPMTISAGSKRAYSSDTDFEKCLICQMSKDDPLYRLTAAGLDTFITVLYDKKDDVYDRLHILIENKDRLLALNPMCHKMCKSIYIYTQTIRSNCKGQEIESFC